MPLPILIVDPGSLSLDNTGKSLTGTVSGGVGGYSITNANGIRIKLIADGGRTFYLWIASVGMVGVNITLTLSTPAPSSGVVTIDDFPTTVTLTDSAGNTPQGQTALSVTNTSTVTLTSFASDDANVADVGMDVLSPSSFQGHFYKAPSQADAVMWEYTYNGTNLWMPAYAFGPGITILLITVDGTPMSIVPQIDSQFLAIPILDGVSAAEHQIQVLVKNNGFYFDVTHTFYGNGTLSAAKTDDGVTYGKVHNLWALPSYIGRSRGMNRWPTGIPLLLTVGMDGQLRFKTTGGAGGATHSYALTVVAQIGASNLQKFWIALRLDGNGALWINHNALGGAKYMLTIDNVEQLPFPWATDGLYRWELLAVGLDATAIDETATWADRWNIVAAGDSIFAVYLNVLGIGNPAGNTTYGDWYQLAVENNWDVQNLGQPGGHAPTVCPLVSNQPEPDVICYGWVTNDLTKDPAVTTSEWTSLLTNTRTRYPNVRIVVEKCSPDAFGQPANVIIQNNAVATAIANIGDSNTLHVNVWDGLTSADYGDSDTHPGPTGYTKKKINEKGFLSPVNITSSKINEFNRGNFYHKYQGILNG